MIVGIGIDSVEIKRFAHWHERPEKELLRLFSPEEITYCLSNQTKNAERFAVRFAAREACYKAVCNILPQDSVPFLKFCKAMRIKSKKPPQLIIGWDNIIKNPSLNTKNIMPFISLTHTKTIATAMVILQHTPR